jgi:integrase
MERSNLLKWVVCRFRHAKTEQSHLPGGLSMPTSTHQLPASAYHLTPADVQKLLLSASNFRDRCLLKTLWWLGVRRSELINLDVWDFDQERKRMTIHKGKGGKTRVIPIINDEYLSDLLMLIGSRKTGPIFLSNRHRAMSLGQSTGSWRLSVRKPRSGIPILGSHTSILICFATPLPGF